MPSTVTPGVRPRVPTLFTLMVPIVAFRSTLDRLGLNYPQLYLPFNLQALMATSLLILVLAEALNQLCMVSQTRYGLHLASYGVTVLRLTPASRRLCPITVYRHS